MAVKKNRALYQIKVTLRDIHPPIWRRIQVWENSTLAQLHRVLQIIMSWEDYHLHDFLIGRRTYSVPDPDDDLYERKVIDEKCTRLVDVVTREGTQFEYLYDLGDSWYHDLLVEAILLPEPAMLYPRCLAGERCPPPEDVGGTIGYESYLEAIADPEHEEYENVLQWRGPFDPESFSVAAVNQQLQKKFHSARKTTAECVSSSPPAKANGAPDLVSLARSFLNGSAIPPAERKRIRPEDKIPLELSNRESDLILKHTFAGDELTRPLRIVPGPGQPHAYSFTLDDLDELAGHVAAEANHAKDKKLAQGLHRLHARIAAILECHTDQDP